MNLAYFTNRYGAASYTFIMTEVAQLRRLGHTVHTFSVRPPPPGEAVNAAVAQEQQNTEYFLDPKRLHRVLPGLAWAVVKTFVVHPGRSARALRLAARTASPGWKANLWQAGYFVFGCYLAERMKARGAEHLHNHLGSSSASIAMLASAVSDVPYSLTIHGGWIFTEPRRWALGEKLARSAFTVCISDFCRSQCMLFSSPTAWPRLAVVRCGVEESFLDAPRTPVPEVPRLVCVGRLSAEKGHIVLLEAVHDVAARGLDIHLTLVGEGPMRPVLEEHIARLGLQERVTITGLVGASAVQESLDGARGFVLASFTEGLPVSVMEAFARQRPVVATQVGAVAELVRPGETGWLVSAGSREGLADALAELLRTPATRLTEMGARGAELVAQRHRASTESLRLESLFEASARSRGAAASAPLAASAAASTGQEA